MEKGGLGGQAAYLSCGEGDFPILRLSQMASTLEEFWGVSCAALLEKVHIETCYSVEDIFDTVVRFLNISS